MSTPSSTSPIERSSTAQRYRSPTPPLQSIYNEYFTFSLKENDSSSSPSSPTKTNKRHLEEDAPDTPRTSRSRPSSSRRRSKRSRSSTKRNSSDVVEGPPRKKNKPAPLVLQDSNLNIGDKTGSKPQSLPVYKTLPPSRQLVRSNASSSIGKSLDGFTYSPTNATFQQSSKSTRKVLSVDADTEVENDEDDEEEKEEDEEKSYKQKSYKERIRICNGYRRRLLHLSVPLSKCIEKEATKILHTKRTKVAVQIINALRREGENIPPYKISLIPPGVKDPKAIKPLPSSPLSKSDQDHHNSGNSKNFNSNLANNKPFPRRIPRIEPIQVVHTHSYLKSLDIKRRKTEVKLGQLDVKDTLRDKVSESIDLAILKKRKLEPEPKPRRKRYITPTKPKENRRIDNKVGESSNASVASTTISSTNKETNKENNNNTVRTRQATVDQPHINRGMNNQIDPTGRIRFKLEESSIRGTLNVQDEDEDFSDQDYGNNSYQSWYESALMDIYLS